ncbi:LacI family DNA-binding transcriptional regulator [Micrococcales bacterium 31B]|nr:LacI family DNA-binding transcriptional regulator [Micrococcales bacterium 31B]
MTQGPGGASVKDVAALAGVSIGTVSNVLNHPERVSDSTRERVHMAIHELGFIRNDAARQLRSGSSTTLGLVLFDISNPFFSELARQCCRAAAEAGYDVFIASSDHDDAVEARQVQQFEAQRVAGLLITPLDETLPELRHVRDRGLPIVLIDRDDKHNEFSAVAVDDVHGGYLAVQHLLGLGLRNIAFVGGPMRLQQVADRYQGAAQAVSEVPDATLEVIATDDLTVLQGRAAGERIVARGEARRPDGIFATNDLLSVGLLQSFTMLGALRVPEDIAIIGYDDIEFASATVVPLSSVRQPVEKIAQHAVEAILRETKTAREDRSPQRIVLKPELVVRRSTVGDAATQ